MIWLGNAVSYHENVASFPMRVLVLLFYSVKLPKPAFWSQYDYWVICIFIIMTNFPYYFKVPINTLSMSSMLNHRVWFRLPGLMQLYSKLYLLFEPLTVIFNKDAPSLKNNVHKIAAQLRSESTKCNRSLFLFSCLRKLVFFLSLTPLSICVCVCVCF